MANLKFYSFAKVIDGQEYCSEVETLAKNMIESKEDDSTIIFPAPNQWASMRNPNYRLTADGAYIILPYRNDEICDFMTITNAEYEFYWKHIYQTAFGLWLGDGEKINTVHTLSRLWDFYNQKPESLKLQ